MTPSAATSPVPRPGAAPRRPSTRRAAVAAVVVLALALRWWGLRFGLPATYHPDEHQYVDAAIAAVGGVWNPGRFNNPSLLKYALAAAYGVWYALGRLAGAWPSVDAWQRATAADPTAAYALARALVGVLGAATCAVVAAIGRRLRGETTGLLAAALLAVAFLHVRDSHYAVNDVPAALLTTLAVAIALRVRAEGRGRDLVVGAVVAGLATATKYTALVAVLPLAIGWLAAGWSDADRPPAAVAGGPGAGTLGRRLRHAGRRLATGPVALAAVAFVAAFLAAVPYAVLDRPAFVADVALLATRGREGFKGLRIDAAPGWIFYLKSLGWGLGWPLLAAAIVGLGLALRRRRADDAIVAVVPLVLWGYLGGQLNMFARFMLPAVPLLCVFAADAVMAVGDRVRKGITGWGSGAMQLQRPYAAGWAWAIAAIVVALPSLTAAIRHDILLGRADTRALARAWIADNVPAGARIVLQSGGPELDGLGFDVESVGTLDLPERRLDDWIADAADNGRGPAWLVTSSFSTERRLLDARRDAAARAWYAELGRRLRPVAVFSPVRPDRPDALPPPFVFDQVYGPCTDLWRFERPGPAITVYRLR